MSDTVLHTGIIQKLKSTLADPVQYALPLGEKLLPLNNGLGQIIHLKFEGLIQCIYCQQKIRKSYQQGYCYPCFQTLARCDFCILKPEKCHFHLGTCREPDWGLQHCFIPHIVYLANTSGIKVGITRETQIPTRWIDQGAVQALPFFRVKNRYQSGLIEVALKKWIADKTDWRKMLKGEGEEAYLSENRTQLLDYLNHEISKPIDNDLELLEEKIVNIRYPVLTYPLKVNALNIEKTPEITGTLLGIKGQYLILDSGVINIRALTGYVVSVRLNTG